LLVHCRADSTPRGAALNRSETSRARAIATRALALLPVAPAILHAAPTLPPVRSGADTPSPALVVVLALTLAIFCGAPFQTGRRRRLRPLGALLGGSVAAGVSFALLGSAGSSALVFLVGGLFAYRGATLGSGLRIGFARFGRYGVRGAAFAGGGFRGRRASGSW
jgi:hypothetical protein